MKQSTDIAVEMITELNDFLRLTLEEDSKERMPLAKELNFVEHYLAIEKYRFGDRLNVRYNIDQRTYDWENSSFLLQSIMSVVHNRLYGPYKPICEYDLSYKCTNSSITG